MRYWYDKEFKVIIREPDCAMEWIDSIYDIALDYDGCNTVEHLKKINRRND